jgi:hypothetical protein
MRVLDKAQHIDERLRSNLFQGAIFILFSAGHYQHQPGVWPMCCVRPGGSLECIKSPEPWNVRQVQRMKQMMEGFQKQWSSGCQRVTLDGTLSGLNALNALTLTFPFPSMDQNYCRPTAHQCRANAGVSLAYGCHEDFRLMSISQYCTVLYQPLLLSQLTLICHHIPRIRR